GHLPPRATRLTALSVAGTIADARKQVSSRIRGRASRPPEAHECLLHHVLGVRVAGHPLPGEQHQRRALPVEPGRPVVVTVRHSFRFSEMKTPLNALFVYSVRTRPRRGPRDSSAHQVIETADLHTIQ